MNELSFNDFKEKIVSDFKKKVSDVEVSIRDINKGNGVTLSGLIISSHESNISPTIYLDSYYYDYYDKGTYDFDECLDLIINAYDKSKVKEYFDVETILSKEFILSNVFPCVANYEKNVDNFNKDDVVFSDQGELGVCYRINLSKKAVGSFSDNDLQTILIKEKMLERAEISFDELNKASILNLKNALVTRNMGDILSEILGDESSMIMGEAEDVNPMFVISNKYNFFGAAGILDKENLDSICNKLDTNVINILPSSIHEVIVINEDSDFGYMNKMIMDINSTELEEKDILSNNVFQYDKTLKQIYCIDNNDSKTICFEFDDSDMPIINNDLGKQRTI